MEPAAEEPEATAQEASPQPDEAAVTRVAAAPVAEVATAHVAKVADVPMEEEAVRVEEEAARVDEAAETLAISVPPPTVGDASEELAVADAAEDAA
eukprot:4625892-Amphidinium_carterae.1